MKLDAVRVYLIHSACWNEVAKFLNINADSP